MPDYSLQHLTESNPYYTESNVRMALKSERGQKWVWIMVEGSNDLDLYGKFFNPIGTKIVKAGYKAKDGSIHGGKKPVEQIVTNILADSTTKKIIGIRDRDYTNFQIPKYNPPQNVFLTDCRDLEMMLLSQANTRTELDRWTNGKFVKIWPQCEKVSRYMAGYRVCNVWKKLNSKVKDFTTTSYWDYNTHTLLTSWQSNLSDEFIHKCPDTITVSNHIDEWLAETLLRFNLNEQDSYCFCRGHDVLSVLSNMLVDTNVYSQKNIMQRLIASYTIVDFEKTNLCKCIVKWSDTIDFDFLISTKT